jgi:SAM-dependent methyltransferase
VDNGVASNSKHIAVGLPAKELARLFVGASTAPASRNVELIAMDVEKVVSEIHSRLRKEGTIPPVSFQDSSLCEQDSSLSSQDAYELTELRSAYQRLYRNRNIVGRMPASPNTFRARIGGYLVRGVQRCLFWYTPQILRFQNEAVSAMNSVCILIGNQSERTAQLTRQTQELHREISDTARDLIRCQAEKTSALEQEVQRLRREVLNLKLDVIRPVATDSQPGLPNSFQFAIQDRFRGSEAETSAKLEVYIKTIQPLLPAIPRAQWLDIGCGRGEWLEAVAKLGHHIVGLDSNPASIRRCREKNLPAQECDALAYLQSLPDASAAVITAFHVVEHWPMHYLLGLVQETVRVLQPGGLLIIETPNPANLLMGSSNFWNDPTHQRPIPLKLLEFVFEYFEFHVVERLQLNPLPKGHWFPFDEVPVVHQLNDYFHGPQDYAVIGRR